MVGLFLFVWCVIVVCGLFFLVCGHLFGVVLFFFLFNMRDATDNVGPLCFASGLIPACRCLPISQLQAGVSIVEVEHTNAWSCGSELLS